jgi:hypothetical protein
MDITIITGTAATGDGLDCCPKVIKGQGNG